MSGQGPGGLLEVKDAFKILQGTQSDLDAVQRRSLSLCQLNQIIQVPDHGNPLLSQQGKGYGQNFGLAFAAQVLTKGMCYKGKHRKH